jgi:hypothetical protein
MSTAEIAEPISGSKLYQERARMALPLLVRQAKAGTPIYYSDLAQELGMPNARNLNYVLGSVGKSMAWLSKKWAQDVPPIQCIVVNKATGLPGEGIGWFINGMRGFANLSLFQRRAMVHGELARIYGYQKWSDVLQALSLPSADADFSSIIDPVTKLRLGGEGSRHLELKNYVANNPVCIGLAPNVPLGKTEFPLQSGDFLDVSFEHRGLWIAAEVKSSISAEADIVRGFFQCVKYRAVMEAVQLTRDEPRNVRALLVLETSLPRPLIALRNTLGVEVIDNVKIPNH